MQRRQQNKREDKVKPGRSHHNNEFFEKCECLGLHRAGCHTRLAGRLFVMLVKEPGAEASYVSQKPDDLTLYWLK